MAKRLFHISEEPGIGIFDPRPSPQHYDAIACDVVFAVSEERLYNYLLPRHCPRVTFYAGPQTTTEDARLVPAGRKAVVAIETAWRQELKSIIVYCYEFAPDSFELLDANAGYYISARQEAPIAITEIHNPLALLASMDVEVMWVPSLWPVAG